MMHAFPLGGRIAALFIVFVFFIGAFDAPPVHAQQQGGGVGAACPQTGEARGGTLRSAGNVLVNATCKTQLPCTENTLPGYSVLWIHDSTECNAGNQIGCCLYFKQANEGVLSEPECLQVGGYCSKTQCPSPDTNIGRCGLEANLSTPRAHCCKKGAVTATTAPTGPTTRGSSSAISNPLGVSTIYAVISRLITAFLGMVGALAFAVFVYAGVTWMTAGSSERVQHAKDAMKYAVIGILMIGLSYAITVFVITAFTRSGSRSL